VPKLLAPAEKLTISVPSVFEVCSTALPRRADHTPPLMSPCHGSAHVVCASVTGSTESSSLAEGKLPLAKVTSTLPFGRWSRVMMSSLPCVPPKFVQVTGPSTRRPSAESGMR
jgi:hypothetical protein